MSPTRTNKTAYRKHQYSGPRKSLKRIRTGLKPWTNKPSRETYWRTQKTKNDQLNAEIFKDEPNIRGTYWRTQKIKIEQLNEEIVKDEPNIRGTYWRTQNIKDEQLNDEVFKDESNILAGMSTIETNDVKTASDKIESRHPLTDTLLLDFNIAHGDTNATDNSNISLNTTEVFQSKEVKIEKKNKNAPVSLVAERQSTRIPIVKARKEEFRRKEIENLSNINKSKHIKIKKSQPKENLPNKIRNLVQTIHVASNINTSTEMTGNSEVPIPAYKWITEVKTYPIVWNTETLRYSVPWNSDGNIPSSEIQDPLATGDDFQTPVTEIKTPIVSEHTRTAVENIEVQQGSGNIKVQNSLVTENLEVVTPIACYKTVFKKYICAGNTVVQTPVFIENVQIKPPLIDGHTEIHKATANNQPLIVFSNTKIENKPVEGPKFRKVRKRAVLRNKKDHALKVNAHHKTYPVKRKIVQIQDIKVEFPAITE